MLGSIYIGLSGMNAYSRGLHTIGNNVSNLNSLGFKTETVSFLDNFSYLGSGYSTGDAPDTGAGVRYGQPHIDFSQGELRQTGGDLDLAVQGNGFLTLLDGDNTVYGRTGQFYVDDAGYISLLGTDYHLAVLDESGQPTAVKVGAGSTSEPAATTTIKFSDNLSSTATEAQVSNITVFDSLGGKHVWQASFTPDAATPGEWQVEVTDESGASIGTSTLKFTGGVVDPSTSTLTITSNPAGAEPLSVVLDFSQGVTSYSTGTTSTLRAASVDGHAVGQLTGVTVNQDGQVELTYSNNETELLGAVAIADLRDPQQLERLGSGLFANRHGADVRMLASGGEGAGRVLAGQVEASNVDLTQEFGDLILVQRGFQASSQVVSVSNDMIQQLFGIRGQG